MLGVIIGAAAVILITKAVRARGGCGSRGFGGPPWSRRNRRGRRGRGWGGLERALDSLDVTAEQEEVIRREVRGLRSVRSTLGDEASRTRADVADVMRSDSLDEEAIANLYVRHDDVIAALRDDIVGALGRIHAVLEPEQRDRLADWLDRGRGVRFGGPYRASL